MEDDADRLRLEIASLKANRMELLAEIDRLRDKYDVHLNYHAEDYEKENAALREENARLREQKESEGGFRSWTEADRALENVHLRKEVFDLREENARLTTDRNGWGDTAQEYLSELTQLRAHVAALVAAGRAFLAMVDEHATGSFGDAQDAFAALLDTPDLAALAREAAAVKAVENAAREWVADLPVGRLQDWEQATVDALRALDAAREGKP